MGVIIPSIPYKSQYDLDADEFRNDCGPASLAMVLHAFGVHASTNAVYRRTEAPANHYVSVAQLMRAAESYGVELDYLYGWTIAQLAEVLQQGRAVIALVHYGAWSQIQPGISTQNTFEGPHFVVVVGVDKDYVYVNDPLWKEERRNQGYHKAWTHAQFNAAWSNNHLDGNRDCSGVITRSTLPVAIYGAGDALPRVQPVTDADTINRLRAWAFYIKAPQPVLTNPATVNAYLAVMGDWGATLARHTVQADESLAQLALRYYGDHAKWKVIQAFNGLNTGDPIVEGDELLIPQPLENPLTIPERDRPSGGTLGLFVNLEKDRSAIPAT